MREHSGGNAWEQKKNVCFILPESNYRMKHYTRFNVFRDCTPCICNCDADSDTKNKFDKANNEIDKKQLHNDFKQLITIRRDTLFFFIKTCIKSIGIFIEWKYYRIDRSKNSIDKYKKIYYKNFYLLSYFLLEDDVW